MDGHKQKRSPHHIHTLRKYLSSFLFSSEDRSEQARYAGRDMQNQPSRHPQRLNISKTPHPPNIPECQPRTHIRTHTTGLMGHSIVRIMTNIWAPSSINQSRHLRTTTIGTPVKANPIRYPVIYMGYLSRLMRDTESFNLADGITAPRGSTTYFRARLLLWPWGEGAWLWHQV
ncbi:hypothetical protein K440DRAFT_376346 [Wilcoxina mikolae CBS 423.85]|nr:hypothetical protein K440DRAFT_376346 [Wilcoxina mikolae CBS 423.85]